MKEADSVVASPAAIPIPFSREFDASLNVGPGAADVHVLQHHATRPVGGEERPGGAVAAEEEGVAAEEECLLLGGCCACRRGGMDGGREEGRRFSSSEACSYQGIDGGGGDKGRELSHTPCYHHHHHHPEQQQHPQQHPRGALQGTLLQGGGGGAGPGRNQDPTPTPASRESSETRVASSRGLSTTGPGDGCHLRESGVGAERRGIEMEDLEAALEGFSAESVRGAGLFASSVEWGDVGGLCGVRAELREILEVHTVVFVGFCVHAS